MNQAHPNFDPSTKAGAHVLSRVARAVDAMEREQLSSAKLELESSRTFSHLSTQVAQLKRAMSALADAVVGELDEIRADHDAWRLKMERHERVIEEKVAAVDATRRGQGCVRRLAREEARSALYELKAEIGNATECVADAKAALAETERRNAETGAALARLKDVARASDVKLQDQVDAIKGSAGDHDERGGVETDRTGVGSGAGGVGNNGAGNNGGIAYASESDLVALRDWAREVATGHDARLRRVEGFGIWVAAGQRDGPRRPRRRCGACRRTCPRDRPRRRDTRDTDRDGARVSGCCVSVGCSVGDGFKVVSKFGPSLPRVWQELAVRPRRHRLSPDRRPQRDVHERQRAPDLRDPRLHLHVRAARARVDVVCPDVDAHPGIGDHGEQGHGGHDVDERRDASAVEGAVPVLHPRRHRKHAHAPTGLQLEILRVGGEGGRDVSVGPPCSGRAGNETLPS